MTARWILLVAAGLSCLGCQASDPSNSQAAASAASDPPAAIAQAPSPTARPAVYVYYFHRRFRCISCQMMEDMAARTVEEHFARQTQAGQVVWMTVNLDDPATEAPRQRLEVFSNGVVLARMENGAYRDSEKLEELWELKDRPDAFSERLVAEINTRLRPARGE